MNTELHKKGLSDLVLACMKQLPANEQAKMGNFVHSRLHSTINSLADNYSKYEYADGKNNITVIRENKRLLDSLRSLLDDSGLHNAEHLTKAIYAEIVASVDAGGCYLQQTSASR